MLKLKAYARQKFPENPEDWFRAVFDSAPDAETAAMRLIDWLLAQKGRQDIRYGQALQIAEVMTDKLNQVLGPVGGRRMSAEEIMLLSNEYLMTVGFSARTMLQNGGNPLSGNN